jgi:hypothetical protein
LFGLAAKTEIWKDAPLLQGFEAFRDRIRDLTGGIPQPVLPAGSIGKDNSEKDGFLSAPILAKRIPQAHNIGAKHRLDGPDSLLELCWLGECPREVHNSIIAR